MTKSSGEPPESPAATEQSAAAAQPAAFEPLLYVHVVIVAAITGFLALLWIAAFYALEGLLWDNDFVSSNRWMFPVICLPFSLIVGLLVKHLRAPTAMSESLVDSLAGDTTKIEWRHLPTTVVQAFASLLSGAALGPEAALGLIASQIAACYGHVLHIRPEQRPRLVYASVASAYNGLLQHPLFAGVLGTEVAETREAGAASLPANLVGGAIGYAVFLSVGGTGLAGLLDLGPVEHFSLLNTISVAVMALLGIVLAAVTGVLFRLATKAFARLEGHVVTRAFIAGVIFSVAGAAAPIVMFSGQSQMLTIVDDPAGYGIGLLVLMALVKLGLLAVGFRSGFLGGAIFPSIFAMVCVALAVSLVFTSIPLAILIAGIMTGFLVTLFRTPFMVILLTGLMLDAGATLMALIVLGVATVLIVSPLLQRVMSRRESGDALGEG